MELKRFTYLNLPEVKEWLRIKPENKDLDNILVRLINTACARVENYIDGPALTREFIEQRDGNSSNVIVPSHRPIVEIVEVKIDFNRAFDTSQPLELENLVIRGMPSLDQMTSDVKVQIIGSDIVIRDDNNTAILGRLFSGSVIQSIQLKYRAGWGDTAEDLPPDLVHATLMLVEYLYILRENRELNVNSKSSNGQSYSRKTGIPEEITVLLDDFKDFSFGAANVPQKNNFTL